MLLTKKIITMKEQAFKSLYEAQTLTKELNSFPDEIFVSNMISAQDIREINDDVIKDIRRDLLKEDNEQKIEQIQWEINETIEDLKGAIKRAKENKIIFLGIML